MPQKGWALDLGKCTGCESCTVACKAELNTFPQQSPLTLKNNAYESPKHVSYRWVVSRNSGAYPDPSVTFVTSSCNHCQNPACMAACPVDAITKRQTDGIVLIDQEKCIGCKYCMWACPYGAPQYNESTQKVEKCTFCVHRQEQGLKPACVTTCTGRALNLVEEFDATASGSNRPDGFADPSHTVPSIGFTKK
ncbi:MAG: 4Fe-4S dicluster domain-containing protein [Dehalococcoidia bacterium]|nr:4Fe-4S dicluster domain-containing protein [Dehalococcoidia bacterium]